MKKVVKEEAEIMVGVAMKETKILIQQDAAQKTNLLFPSMNIFLMKII